MKWGCILAVISGVVMMFLLGMLAHMVVNYFE
jgi:hypothetical protein